MSESQNTNTKLLNCLTNLIAEVQLMRNAQKQYFQNSHTPFNKTFLMSSIEREKFVDSLCLRILDNIRDSKQQIDDDLPY
jgi:hypothetical protein